MITILIRTQSRGAVPLPKNLTRLPFFPSRDNVPLPSISNKWNTERSLNTAPCKAKHDFFFAWIFLKITTTDSRPSEQLRMLILL